VGVPLKVNSGYRCIAHNFDVGGKSLSRHTVGQAIDISLKSLDHLSNEEIEFAAKKAGFTFIKFYKTFVHMDVRWKSLIYGCTTNYKKCMWWSIMIIALTYGVIYYEKTTTSYFKKEC